MSEDALPKAILSNEEMVAPGQRGRPEKRLLWQERDNQFNLPPPFIHACHLFDLVCLLTVWTFFVLFLDSDPTTLLDCCKMLSHHSPSRAAANTFVLQIPPVTHKPSRDKPTRLLREAEKTEERIYLIDLI